MKCQNLFSRKIKSCYLLVKSEKYYQCSLLNLPREWERPTEEKAIKKRMMKSVYLIQKNLLWSLLWSVYPFY